jgi:pyridoxal phosphate enzyme (YggS family)
VPESVEQRLNEINERIIAAAVRAGRSVDAIRLIAVSKTFPVSFIEDAYAAGQRVFGESRVQELASKTPVLPDDIEWHLIGHLQRNKARPAVGVAHLIHSIDSIRLAQRIDGIASELGVCQDILLQANVTGEATKFGMSLDQLSEALDVCSGLPAVNVKGFMTMAPFAAEAVVIRRCFAALRDYAAAQRERLDLELPELSMGMSSDFEIAIEEGATLVRVGTAIFGSR